MKPSDTDCYKVALVWNVHDRKSELRKWIECDARVPRTKKEPLMVYKAIRSGFFFKLTQWQQSGELHDIAIRCVYDFFVKLFILHIRYT